MIAAIFRARESVRARLLITSSIFELVASWSSFLAFLVLGMLLSFLRFINLDRYFLITVIFCCNISKESSPNIYRYHWVVRHSISFVSRFFCKDMCFKLFVTVIPYSR